VPSRYSSTTAESRAEAPARDSHDRPDPAELFDWYERHARVLAWRVGPADRRRGLRPDPYRVWLSEVMLQQTTVKAVAPYYRRFLERWPNVHDLAAAEDNDVMAAWAGLGYYSRARNLLACARAVAARPGARFPTTAVELAQLPGIGPYTAAAIAAIAFDEPVAVVDGNVERVTARLFALHAAGPAVKTVVRDRLQPLVPSERAGEFAEAVMDLGATICTPKKPACVLCPWRERCAARRAGRQEDFPVRAAKRERPIRHGVVFVARRADGAILLRRRPPRGLLGGMSEPPGGGWDGGETAAGEPFAADWVLLPRAVDHGFTHFELRLAVHRAEVAADAPAPAGHWWAAPGTLAEEALPNLMKKAIEAAFPGATKPARRTP
jgi:A/G-specific adenine glycosylase